MQAAVSRWLLQTKGIAAQEEWVAACVEWILNEEGSHTSQQKLQELVYEQWLHADLRDVSAQPGIPGCVGQREQCQISGRFIVQVDSIIDVGAPAYGQLQKLKGRSLDTADTPKKNHDPKPTRLLLLSLTDGATDFQAMEYQPIPHLSLQTLPGTKLLLQGSVGCHLGVLLLTAGNVQVLGGSVEHLVERNQQKRLLARALNNEGLAEENQPSSNANPLESNQRPVSATHAQPPGRTPDARLTNTESESDVIFMDVIPHTDMPYQSSSSISPAASSYNRLQERGVRASSRSINPGKIGVPSLQPREQVHRGSRECDVMVIDSSVTDTSTMEAGPEVTRIHGTTLQCIGDDKHKGIERGSRDTRELSGLYSDGGVAEDLDMDAGDMDFDDFDNFDAEEEHIHGDQGVQGEGIEHRDVSIDEGVGSLGYRNEDTMPTNPEVHSTDTCNKWWRASDTTLPKGSERNEKSQQRNYKLGFAKAEVPVSPEDLANEGKALPVASVKPMPITQAGARQSLVVTGKTLHKFMGSGISPLHSGEPTFEAGSEKPVLLKLSDICSGSVWKTSPVMRVKAHFIKVVEKLSHASGEWMVTVLIGDDTGAKLHVHLSNEILELLIGFTAQEFKQNIEPYKLNSAVKAKGSRGFKRCQSALADLNCFMELRKRTFHRYPFVEKLLDSA